LLNTDQRGYPRVGRCDIGAYEFQGTVSRAFLPVAIRNYCPDFFDDFSNPISGWPVGESSFVRAEYLGGEYRVLSKQPFLFLFRAPACERHSYIVEADMRWVGTPGSDIGILFSLMSDFSQYYFADINTDAQAYAIFRRSPSGFSLVAPPAQHAAIHPGAQTNHLKVTRDGGQITLEINGQFIGSWTDYAIGGFTYVGLAMAPYEEAPVADARFDNFRMTKIDPTAAQDRTPATPSYPLSIEWYPPDQDRAPHFDGGQ
jgi:hypothetical protein